MLDGSLGERIRAVPTKRNTTEVRGERTKPLVDLAALRQEGRVVAVEIDGLELEMRNSKRKAYTVQLLDAQKRFFLSELKSNDPDIVKRAVANLEWLRDSVQRLELGDAVESETEPAHAESSVEPVFTDARSESLPDANPDDRERRSRFPTLDINEPEVFRWHPEGSRDGMDRPLYPSSRPLPEAASVPLSARTRALRKKPLGKRLRVFLAAAFGLFGFSNAISEAPHVKSSQLEQYSMGQPAGAPGKQAEQEDTGQIVEKVPKKLVVHNLADLTLKRGSSGPHVRELQKFLNAHGFKVAETGRGSPGRETTDFGPLTEAALRRFQKACVEHGGRCPVSGHFGASTWKEIERLYGPEVAWWELSSDIAHRTPKT